MSPITTHVLDISRGKPAEGIAVILLKQQDDNSWAQLAQGTTNADGRVLSLLKDDATLAMGSYQLRFATGPYFNQHGVRGFYPEVQVIFQIDNPKEHFHVPLLLSPYGYSTYRGS